MDVRKYWENPKKKTYDYNYTVGGALIYWLLKNSTEEQMKALLADQSIDSAREIYPDFNQIMDEFQEKLNGR